MSTLDPAAGWPVIDGIDTTERLLGGTSGPLNRAASGLTARTKQLLAATDALGTTTAGLATEIDAATLLANSVATALSAYQTLLSGPTGAAQIGVSSTSTVADALNRLTIRSATVNDYGAKMDGVTNDAAAFQAMAAATNGVIVMQAGEYYVGNLILPMYDDLIIVGAGMPTPNANWTRSYGGSILIGGVNTRARRVRIANWGADLGTGRGFDTTVGIDGIVLNAPVGETGSFYSVNNITSIGPGESGSSHRLLCQGFDSGQVDNVALSDGQYGWVNKCRNTNGSNIITRRIRTACVYPKSDLPEYGGDVADATCAGMNVDNVINLCSATNTECVGVYVHASTAAIKNVNVSRVYQVYGHSPGRVQGAGTLGNPAPSGVTFSQLLSESAQYGLFSGGYTYDWSADLVHAINPQTGRLWYTDTTSNGRISNSGVLVTDTALPTTYGNLTAGQISLSGLYARRPDAQMVITVSAVPSQLKTSQLGYLTGNLRYSLDQNLTGQNGAVADTTRPPTFRVAPGGKVELGGRFNLAASTNKFFCNLPVTTGLEYFFPGVYVDANDHSQPCAIRLNSFQLSLEAGTGTGTLPLPTGAKYVYLDGITITL